MKKLCSLFLSFAVMLTLLPTAFAAERASGFTDVPANAWYREELDYAVYNRFISGTSDSTFSPLLNLSRAQFVTLLGKMLGVNTADYTSSKFDDVDPNSWYGPYVAWAADKGYVNGVNAKSFVPENFLTVEQLGVVIDNYITETGVELKGTSPAKAYADASAISAWAVSGMETMRQYNLLVTDTAGNVNPSKRVVRAEAAVSLVRLAKAMGLGVEPPVVEQKPSSLANQPVLAGKGITYADLIPGNPQLITRHDVNDMAAVDNNIRYMLKTGQSEIRLDMAVDVDDDPWGGEFGPNWDISVDASSAEDILKQMMSAGLSGKYGSQIRSYEEFGYNTVVMLSSSDGTTIGFENSSFSETELIVYREKSLSEAVRVHDALWASGAIKSTMTQKEKAKVYFDWIVQNCDYDTDALKYYESHYNSAGQYGASWLAYGALVNGKAVCEGYTGAYNLLLKLEGIDCATDMSLTGNHIWTTATLDGVLYHIDATWGDQNNIPAKQYFCMTPDASWARFK